MNLRPRIFVSNVGWICCWLWLHFAAQPAMADDALAPWHNVAIVAVQGLDGWRGDLGTADQPLSVTLPDYLAKRTGIVNLAGLDGERSAFVVLRTDGITLAPVAVIPVVEAEALLVSLRPALGEVERLRPGVWKLGRREWTAFALEQEGWLYVAQTEALLLGDFRPNPAEVLQQVPADYDLAIVVQWQNLPEVFRSWAIDRHREAVKVHRAFARIDQGQPAAADALVERLLFDLDRLTLGWNYTAAGEAELTFSLRAKSGSPLAELQQGLSPSSLPAGWTEDAARPTDKARDERCLHVELNLELTSEAAALVRQIFGPNPNQGERLVPGSWMQQQALLALSQGKLQAGVSIHGRRPPAAITWNIVGGDPAEWRSLFARTLGGANAAGATREPQPVAPLAVDSQALPGLPAWQLPLDGNDLLKNLAGPGCEALVVERAATLHGVVAENAGDRLKGRLAVVTQAADDARLPSQPTLFSLEIRMAALLRLFSIAAEDWETKALLGKLTLVIQPERDHLRCTLTRHEDELRLRISAGRGLTQAAALGLTLLMLQ